MLTSEQISSYIEKTHREIRQLQRSGELTSDDVRQIYDSVPDSCWFFVNCKAIPALLSVHFDYDDLMGIVREVVRVRDELKQYSVVVDCSELAERFFLNQRCGDILEV